MSELPSNVEAALGGHRIDSSNVALESLDQLWKPFLVLSRAFGVFPFATLGTDRKVRWWRNWWNLFSITYVGVAFGVFAMFVVSIATREKSKLTKVEAGAYYLSFCAFYLHVILSTSTFIYLLNSKPYLDDLCRLWSCLSLGHNTTSKLNADIRRKVRRNLALTVLGCLIYIYTTIALHAALERYNPMEVSLGMFFTWCLIANAVQLGLFCTVCRTSSYLLESICHVLEAKLAEDGLDAHLKWFRGVFMSVVDFIEVSNQLFRRYAGFLVTFCLIETCCNTYLFLPFHKPDVNLIVSDFIYVVEGLVIIGIVFLSAGEIPEQFGRPFRVLLKANLSESPSNSQIQEMMLILGCSRHLSGYISMFGIMTITKESLPMIFGMYLSYVFVLYQFPKDSGKQPQLLEVANCTFSN